MTRRSTRLMRLENSLYSYNSINESWDIKEITPTNKTLDIFERGSYFTCKHMSQKVNPISFRISNNKTWNSAWYTDYKPYGIGMGKLHIDLSVRDYLESVFKELHILIDKIYIKEINGTYVIKVYLYEQGVSNRRDISINTKKIARFQKQGLLNNKESINPFYMDKKQDSKSWFIHAEKVIAHIEMQLKKQFSQPMHVSLVYRKDIGESASLLGKFLCKELERPNVNFKKALRDSLLKIKTKDNIRGLRVNCSGRLSRAPMAKMEWFRYGSIPLTKMSADIDYVQLAGHTRYGSFGLKVWLYRH